MEMTLWFCAALFALAAITIWLLLRQRRLRKEIYEYTDRLEQMISDMLKEKPIQAKRQAMIFWGKPKAS